MSLIIYSEKKSPRLKYILDFIFNEVLLCEYTIETDINKFSNVQGAKLNYSSTLIKGSTQIVPHKILFENIVEPQEINCTKWKEQTSFFTTSQYEISFDIFAASFYLTSRYEEYLENEVDEFERFPHIKSVAFQHNFLNIPLVDNWLIELKKILFSHFPDLVFKQKKFNFLPTYDIDIAYSYKNKGLFRNTAGFIKDLFRFDFRAISNRWAVLLGAKKDPFDSFDFLDTLHLEYKLSPIYFFLLGSGGKLDKNLSVENFEFKELIRRITSKYTVGIHPSYRSNDEATALNIEVQSLNTIANIQTTKSRQHYIRFTLPATYQKLIKLGITEDYSMGYGSINGFRASTSHQFNWFDLEKNEATDLKIYPFCFMECNSFFEQKQSLAKTQIEIGELITAVKNVQGTFISIWHNFSLGSDPLWKDWSKLYIYQIERIQKK